MLDDDFECSFFKMSPRQAAELFAPELKMSPEELSEFKRATNHPLACTCSACERWWELCGESRDL